MNAEIGILLAEDGACGQTAEVDGELRGALS
jgi:hypothetical protein